MIFISSICSAMCLSKRVGRGVLSWHQLPLHCLTRRQSPRTLVSKHSNSQLASSPGHSQLHAETREPGSEAKAPSLHRQYLYHSSVIKLQVKKKNNCGSYLNPRLLPTAHQNSNVITYVCSIPRFVVCLQMRL